MTFPSKAPAHDTVGHGGQRVPRVPLAVYAVTWLAKANPDCPDTRSTRKRARCCTSRTSSAPSPARMWRPRNRLIDAGTCSSATRAQNTNECAIKLAPATRSGRGRHVVVSAYGSFHGRTLATLHTTGQPGANRSNLAGGLPPCGLGRHGPRSKLHSTRRSPRCSSSRCKARAASIGVCLCGRGDPCSVRRARHPPHVRRGPDRPRPHGRRRLPALRRATGCGDDGQGPRQRPPHRSVLGSRPTWPAHSSRATFGGQPLATATAQAVLAEMQRIDAPASSPRVRRTLE